MKENLSHQAENENLKGRILGRKLATELSSEALEQISGAAQGTLRCYTSVRTHPTPGSPQSDNAGCDHDL